MARGEQRVFADDPDAYAVYTVSDSFGSLMDFDPNVRVGTTTKIASWLSDVGYERDLKVPLTGLSKGTYTLRLIIPGDNDLWLGDITLY